ncbi:MAG TPA: protein kinase, partial [Polyangiaceae bacterium]|nr:protein kinase [Polyangiaceae bacterium]
MGAVYEARDRERNRSVAVKTLVRFDAGAFYLFKQEFRTLANLLHPNLVRLYDLVASGPEGVFFTMELVSGRNFRDHVWRPEALTAAADPLETTEGRPRQDEADRRSGKLPVEGSRAAGGERRPRTPADIERLRGALRQLVQGVQAVHAAGKVHRDIKPSNVVVDGEGRVVLLDFGIAAELSGALDRRLLESNVAGTPAYMAPEQALDGVLTSASDWYSVGVLLYEALVGKPPFTGDATDILYRKALLDAPAPAELVEGVPEDLDALCRDLLQREPEHRPSGARVLRRLGVEPRIQSPTPIAGFEHRSKLVGRGGELRALHQAYVRVRTGGSVIVRVRGASGMGKSALVRHFLDGLVTRSDAVVLRGCAYERESVAYKAVDGVVDALSRCLAAFEQRGEAVPLPPEAWALAQLFPVLTRVPAIATQSRRSGDDPHRRRQRAFRAFRSILSRLTRIGPTVLHLDDVQWGDVDSAMLLLDVMRPPDAPPVLVILGYRDDADSEASPFLAHLKADGLAGFDVRDLSVEPLDLVDARHLALGLLGSDDEVAQRVADAIAQGAGGSALFVEDLARSARVQGLPASPDALLADAGSTLDEMIHRRVARLDEGARGLLELASVHGRPIPTSILERAAGGEGAFDARLSDLRARHFLRVATRDGRETAETTHDRIRETVAGRLPLEGLRGCHRRLAVAYEAERDVDAEAIVVHWFGAGELARAAAYAERAAVGAVEKLAFDRGIQLYRLTLDALDAGSADALRIRERLAEALAWAGRGAEAAGLYLEIARVAPSGRRAGLERAGANELLMCGEIDEGTRILRRALARIGRGAPGTPWSAFFWLLFYGAWLRVIGVKVVAREAEEVPARVREELEALYAAVAGLALVDAIVGASLIARMLVLALRSRNRPAIIAAALLRTNQLATSGGPETAQRRALVAL